MSKKSTPSTPPPKQVNIIQPAGDVVPLGQVPRMVKPPAPPKKGS
ncbi:hypothetical protein [Marinoscillum sp. 108]|nr:hypothetical protein [Marinoscillum sp. 108]